MGIKQLIAAITDKRDEASKKKFDNELDGIKYSKYEAKEQAFQDVLEMIRDMIE